MEEFSKKRTIKNADGALSETFTNSAEQGVISQLDYFDHDITNDANISGYYVVQPDDFVYNPRISATAPCGPINRNRLDRAGVMSPLYTVFSVDASVDKTYLEHYFKTSRWHDFMFLEGNSGARSDRFSISDATFFEMPIWCPEISEQKAIAKQLETADHLITLHQRKCQYRGLYGYLSWEQRKLEEFSKKRTTKNADGALSETFTNSAEQGVISQLDYFDHDITNDANISGYYVVQPDDFVYNPRISATAPCGPINRNRLDRAGVMSPLYTVFSVDASVDKTYLEHYFKTSRWHDFMFLEGNSGARSDRFSISDATFFEMPIWCPEISEQKAIAKQLETADHLITLHQRQSNGRVHNIIILSRTKNRQLDIAKSAVLGLETRGNSRKLLNEHPIQQRFLDIP